jgi:hypothetical protein
VIPTTYSWKTTGTGSAVQQKTLDRRGSNLTRAEAKASLRTQRQIYSKRSLRHNPRLRRRTFINFDGNGLQQLALLVTELDDVAPCLQGGVARSRGNFHAWPRGWGFSLPLGWYTKPVTCSIIHSSLEPSAGSAAHSFALPHLSGPPSGCVSAPLASQDPSSELEKSRIGTSIWLHGGFHRTGHNCRVSGGPR